MGMFGILVMIGENELSSAGVYTKVSKEISYPVSVLENTLLKNHSYCCNLEIRTDLMEKIYAIEFS